MSSQSCSVARLGVDSVRLHHQRHGVAHLGEHLDLALVLRVEQVADRVDVRGQLRVDDQARHPALPRDGVLPARVEADVLEVVANVRLDVRDAGRVQVLDVAQVMHLLGHPVGHHDDAPPARLALGEQRLHLGEELLVVVDVLDVVDLDAGCLLEVRHRLLVDVERPVRDRHVTGGRRLVLHGLDLLGSAPSLDPIAATARRQRHGGAEGGGSQSQGLCPLRDSHFGFLLVMFLPIRPPQQQAPLRLSGTPARRACARDPT